MIANLENLSDWLPQRFKIYLVINVLMDGTRCYYFTILKFIILIMHLIILVALLLLVCCCVLYKSQTHITC